MKRFLYMVMTSVLLYACAGKEEKTEYEISIASIPTGSMMICYVADPAMAASAMDECLYIKALDSMSVVQDIKEGLHLYSLLGGGKLNGPLIISSASVRAKELSCMYISRLSPAETISAVTHGDTTITTRKYENRDIHTLTVPSGQIHYYHESGMTIASTDALYIEQSLLQTTSGINMTSDAAFVKAYDRISRTDGVALAVSPSLLTHFAENQMGMTDISLAGQLSPWINMEIQADSASVKANGVFCADDSVRTYAGVLAGQKELPVELDAYFPSSTYAYTYIGIDDWNEYFEQYALYLKSSAQYHKYNVAVQKYDSLMKGDFKKFFTPWAGRGVAVVRMTGGKYSPEQNVMFMGVKDADAAYSALEKIKDATVAAPDPYRSHKIIRTDERWKNIFSSLVSPVVGEKGIRYITVAGDVMVGAYDLTLLKHAVEDISAGSTLTTLPSYTSAKDHLATATVMLTMVRADLYVKEMKNLIREKRKKYPIRLTETEKYIWNNGNMLLPLRYNFMQISPTEGIPFINMYGIWNTETPREAVKSWTYVMASAPAVRTVPFPNHKTGRVDVLCMDKTGYVYLLSDTGTLFWKKKLPAPCEGDIRIVDLYKNRKYQMAFTAGGKFYVIDRNGSPVTAKDKVAAARKASTIPPSARVTSTNTIEVSRGGKNISVKTAYSPVQDAVYLRSKDIIVYSTSTGQIYGMKSSGEEIAGFPIPAAEYFTAEDFSKKGTLGIVTTTQEGTVSMYSIPIK